MNDSTESKLRKMEEEMSRFEAEISTQLQPFSTSQISGGFMYQPVSYLAPQIAVNPYCAPMLSAPGVYMSGFAPLPPALPQSASSPPKKPAEKPPPPGSKTTISAPPQMAGPDELAARAKETLAAAETAKLNAEDDDDDDVTRALLAAAAGVTYSHSNNIDAKNTVKSTHATESKPPPPPPPPPPTKPAAQPSNPAAAAAVAVEKAPPAPPPLYTIHLDTSIPPPPAPVPMVRSAQTTTEEPYSFQKKKYRRVAAGMVWEDPTLADWDPNDFRLFCGDLGNEVTDETLSRTFCRYASFKKAKVIKDKRSDKSRGYGFVSFSDPNDFTRAMREMNGKYIGNRPIKLKKSDWKSRQLETYRKREKEKKKLGLKI